jgi:hypothetical protein
MILNFISLILIFVFVWITVNLWHELFHCLEAKRQGASKCRVSVNWFGMTYSYSGSVNNTTQIRLAGGVYSSVLCFLLVFFVSTPSWAFSFWTLGWVQLFYGLYEGYVGCKYRYVLYAVVVCVCIVWWWFIG